MSRRPRGNSVENRMVKALDNLQAYEEFCEGVLPLLRRAISEKWTPEQIENHPVVKAAIVARQITTAVKDPDASKALAAIKDLRDRSEGKAIERKEVKHQFESLSDAELDARLKALEDEGADEHSEPTH